MGRKRNKEGDMIRGAGEGGRMGGGRTGRGDFTETLKHTTIHCINKGLLHLNPLICPSSQGICIGLI